MTSESSDEDPPEALVDLPLDHVSGAEEEKDGDRGIQLERLRVNLEADARVNLDEDAGRRCQPPTTKNKERHDACRVSAVVDKVARRVKKGVQVVTDEVLACELQRLNGAGVPREKAPLSEHSASDQKLSSRPGLLKGTSADSECDDETVASITSLRRGGRLLSIAPTVAPGAVSVIPGGFQTLISRSFGGEEQQQSMSDTVLTDSGASGEPQPSFRVPEATMVHDTPLVRAVRESPPTSDDNNETVTTFARGCSWRTVGWIFLALIGVVVTAAVVLVGDNNNKSSVTLVITLAPSMAPSSSPSASLRPSLSPSNSFQTDLVELIQVCSPKTSLSVNYVMAALEWMVNDDPYSVALEGNADSLVQRFALVTLWFALELESSSGRAIEEWMQPMDECDWNGNSPSSTLQCDPGGLVVALDLVGLDAPGFIPLEISLLSHLMYLSVAGNELTGSIPSELALLSSLTTLQLGSNFYSGTIPFEVWTTLTNMKKLYVQSNPNMSPSVIPSNVASLTKLTALVLQGAQLSGSIPTDLASMTTLKVLDISNNTDLTGSIPAQFGMLSLLSHLGVSENQLTGPLPTEFGLLDSLETLKLSYNSFTGTIPSECGLLARLSMLLMYDCGVIGTIPTEIGQLQMLTSLNLGGNDLTGTLPSELGLLTSLETLTLDNNRFSGSVPSELASLSLLGNKS